MFAFLGELFVSFLYHRRGFAWKCQLSLVSMRIGYDEPQKTFSRLCEGVHGGPYSAGWV